MGCLAAAACALLVTGADAQRRRGGFNQYFGSSEEFYQPPAYHGNPLYDGRFTFARIKYRGFDHFGPEGPGWSHDYPDAEENFTKILRDISAVNPFVEAGPIVGSALVALDDSTLFKYPVSYMSEPGAWATCTGSMSDSGKIEFRRNLSTRRFSAGHNATRRATSIKRRN